MKIQPIGLSGVNLYKKAMNKFDESKQPEHDQKDKVEISAAAKEMQEASQLTADRQKKVNELKQKIESGEYKPHPEEIAKGILRFYRR
ncbi:flagellar biosynthesis anti-sigma factor FlgM [Bacillus smithii]|uniref:flagellar biosynthesis anti-sigma factor FlgM n=1 Tax=Bacillus smithii TaxID=1479 RepID=UPI0030C9AEB4